MARYIDADEAEYTVLHLDVDVAKHKCKDYESYINGANQFRHQVKVALRHTPTADVEEVRHGRWLPQVVGGVKAWDCSECKTIGSPQWKRCPICEAKMDGGKEE